MRILSLTTDTSLAVALSLMSEDREVVPVRSTEDLTALPVSDFDVTMIDLGSTSRGLAALELLESRGIHAPCLVLGDEDSGPTASGVSVLPRPFTMEQLDLRLNELGRPAESAQASGFTARSGRGLLGRMRRRRQAPPKPSSASEPQPPGPAASEIPVAPEIAAESPKDTEQTSEQRLGQPGTELEAPQGAELDAGPEPLDADEDVSREEALVSAWTELIVEDHDQPAAQAPVAEEPSPEAAPEVLDLRAQQSEMDADPQAEDVPETEDAPDIPEASGEHDDSPEATVREHIGEDAADQPDAPEAAAELPREVEDAVDGRESTPRPLPHIYPRFRGEGQRPGGDRTGSLSRMLVAGSELESLLDQMPHLVDRQAVATRLLREVEQTFAPAACQLWVPAENGTYALLAGLAVDEQADLRVQPDQSLFLSFEANLEAILVSPLDPAQRPVAGIPGLVGDALLGCALRVDDALHGVVLVMGTQYVEEDLDRLWGLTAPVAPLLALATLITRLRARQFITLPSSPEREVEFFSNL